MFELILLYFHFKGNTLHYVDMGCQTEPWVLEGGYRWRMAGSYQNESYKAYVRCCSIDGESCSTMSNCQHQSKATTYYDAVSQCASIGKRLCTKDELWNETIETVNSKSSTHWTCCESDNQCTDNPVWTSSSISGNRISSFIKRKLCILFLGQ